MAVIERIDLIGITGMGMAMACHLPMNNKATSTSKVSHIDRYKYFEVK